MDYILNFHTFIYDFDMLFLYNNIISNSHLNEGDDIQYIVKYV